ncbi:MAG: hypothetical protein ACREQQ_04635 [Candidatus Binatia bacterium]
MSTSVCREAASRATAERVTNRLRQGGVADVGVRGGKIAAVGRLSESAGRTIEGEF